MPNDSGVTSVVIWNPNQISEVGKRGRDLAREIALSLLRASYWTHARYCSILKFAVETNDLYVMDTAGKQHKMGIVKTIEGGPSAVGQGCRR